MGNLRRVVIKDVTKTLYSTKFLLLTQIMLLMAFLQRFWETSQSSDVRGGLKGGGLGSGVHTPVPPARLEGCFRLARRSAIWRISKPVAPSIRG